MVSGIHPEALPLRSDARVFSSFLEAKEDVAYSVEPGRGLYFYVVEGGAVTVNGLRIPILGAGKITDEPNIEVIAEKDSALLLSDVLLS